jgi:hypothetical protein
MFFQSSHPNYQLLHRASVLHGVIHNTLYFFCDYCTAPPPLHLQHRAHGCRDATSRHIACQAPTHSTAPSSASAVARNPTPMRTAATMPASTTATALPARHGNGVQTFFCFQRNRLFFRSCTTYFRARKISTFFQISSNFFQINLFSSSLFYSAYTPSDRLFPESQSDPPPNPKMGFFYACRPSGGLGMGLPKQQQISEVTTTIFRTINNKFQKFQH